MTEKKPFRPSFYLTINSIFIIFILVVGGVLTWHNYTDTRRIVLAEANRDYDQTLDALTKDFRSTYKSVFDTVNLLSMTPVMEASSLAERLQHLDIFSTSLQSRSEVAGIQIGYANGDYFIVRQASSSNVRALFGAPEETAYILDNISTDQASGQRLLERLFYDSKLTEIQRQPPEVTEYDPRVRPWYLKATKDGQVSAVDPYLFYFLKEIGTTISYEKPGSGAVVAADVTLRQVSMTLNKYLLTPGSEIALVTADGFVLGYNKPERTIIDLGEERFKIAHVKELGSEVFKFIDSQGLLQPGSLSFQYNGKGWHGSAHTIKPISSGGSGLTLVMISPLDELLANAIAMYQRSLFITIGILLIAIPFASLVARMISRALNKLAEEAVMISRFDFSRPLALQSKIKEIDELARSMELMKDTIGRFLSLIKSLSSERNFDAMLEQITEETLDISLSDGALTWFIDEDTNTLNPAAFFVRNHGKIPVDGLSSRAVDDEHALIQAAGKSEVSQVTLRKGDDVGLASLFESLGSETIVVTAFPLKDRKEEGIGLLCLLNKVEVQNEEEHSADGRMDFVRTFSGFASVSLESRHLLEMQKRLMDSFMHLLAGAIDAKSPYTGGHCQRVPVLAKMLAAAACEDDDLFKDYQLDEDGWEALHLAGWLHDCGKVTTPEYVVDKSTKLETIYDRIHEIRTRFEVLKRDAEIRCWEQVANGGDKDALRETLATELQEIDADFIFLAECNLGDDFMSPEKVERLEAIAKRTWKRTLDDRIGISWEEEKRKSRLPDVQLPVEEGVIADRLDHLIERVEGEQMPADNPWGFKLTVPEYRYNLGELYNLKIERGTLTMEERYKINDHVVQTIIMLEKLPYPKHLREVPSIAGGHHEKMDGKGYPKQLQKEQMSLAARMMAIADIFEALTASDRPYKKAKKLSDAIRIMSFFRNDQHIDADLFALFLKSGVYLDYASKYLDPDQVDPVDIESYL